MNDNEKEEAANLVRVYKKLLNCFNYRILSPCFAGGHNYFILLFMSYQLFQKEEFEWVLREEVHAILHQLHSVLVVSNFHV